MLRPLDFGKPHPFGEIIGKPRNLAWPVNAYRVTLPRASDDGDGLNPFEHVILKLLDAVGVMDASALADETHIPLDLVKGILLRLQDKALIDEHNAIIEQEYDNRESEEEKAPVFVTALLFRELATGKTLPLLRWLDDANPLRKQEGEGRGFRSIRWDEAHKRNPPAQRDVISALRAMKRRSATLGSDEKMPAVQQVAIVREPELHYLDCPIAIQKSDGEFRIADPFGNGFSLILERAFEQLLEQDEQLADWLHRWKQSLSNPRSPKQDSKPKELFENEFNQRHYPNLVASLQSSRNAPFRSLAHIHASIEWALFYTCCRRSFEDVIAKLKFTGPLEHTMLLGNAAQNVGLVSPRHGFKSIPKGKLLDFQNGKAEFGTVLAITIVQAEGDESHPLRQLASMYPDLISRFLSIKKKRDEKGHGKGRADAPDDELSDDPFLREVVHTLLPDIVFSDTPATRPNKDVRADSLLEARTSVQSEFRFMVLHRLGANLQDRLVQAERFWLSCKVNDDARHFVCDLYAALQANFRRWLSGKLPPNIMDSDLITSAQRKARESGFGDLPECLHTVRPLAIRETLQGNDPTLGACVVAFLLMSDDDTLHSIAHTQPSFIDDITKIIAKRGHGNEPLRLPKTEVAELRKAAYNTIKVLIEV